MDLLMTHTAYRDLLMPMEMLMGMPIGDLLLPIRLPLRMLIEMPRSSIYGCQQRSPTANRKTSRDLVLLIRVHMGLLLHIGMPIRISLKRKGCL